MLEAIKSVKGWKYLTDAGAGRHLLRVPFAAMRTHPDFISLRGGAAKAEKTALLTGTMKDTGGTSLQFICVLAEQDDSGRVILTVADGHQRYEAEKANGTTEIVVEWIDRWTDRQIAMKEALSLNFARSETGDEAVISVMARGRIMDVDVAKWTGYAESKISGFRCIVDHEWAKEIFLSKTVGWTTLVKLIKACDGDAVKLSALGKLMLAKLASAVARADVGAAKIAAAPNKKWSKQDQAEQYPKHFMNMNDYGAWERAIKLKAIQTDDDGMLVVSSGSGNDNDGDLMPRVGSPEEWRTKFALEQCAGEDFDDIAKDGLKLLLDNWDTMKGYIRAKFEQRVQAKAELDNPLPIVTTERAPRTPKAKKQKPDSIAD